MFKKKKGDDAEPAEVKDDSAFVGTTERPPTSAAETVGYDAALVAADQAEATTDDILAHKAQEKADRIAGYGVPLSGQEQSAARLKAARERGAGKA